MRIRADTKWRLYDGQTRSAIHFQAENSLGNTVLPWNIQMQNTPIGIFFFTDANIFLKFS